MYGMTPSWTQPETQQSHRWSCRESPRVGPCSWSTSAPSSAGVLPAPRSGASCPGGPSGTPKVDSKGRGVMSQWYTKLHHTPPEAKISQATLPESTKNQKVLNMSSLPVSSWLSAHPLSIRSQWTLSSDMPKMIRIVKLLKCELRLVPFRGDIWSWPPNHNPILHLQSSYLWFQLKLLENVDWCLGGKKMMSVRSDAQWDFTDSIFAKAGYTST